MINSLFMFFRKLVVSLQVGALILSLHLLYVTQPEKVKLHIHRGLGVALAPVSSLTEDMKVLNPGHGRRWKEKLLKEREKLERVLGQRSLTLRFIDMAHGSRIRITDLDGFSKADVITLELPPSVIRAYQSGNPTKVNENSFWMDIIEGAHALRGTNGLTSVYGVDGFDPARDALRRLVYFYTDFDLSFGGRPRRKILLHGGEYTRYNTGFSLRRLTSDPAQPEAVVLSRLTEEQRQILNRKRVLYLDRDSMNPFSSTGRRLEKDVVLYRPPHSSFQEVVNQIRYRYGTSLRQFGIAERDFNEAVVLKYLLHVPVLLRDQTQLHTIYRRLQMQLRSSKGQSTQRLLVLHVGGATHSKNLDTLARYSPSNSSPIIIDHQNDPRFPLFKGDIKGTEFFATRYEEILDHVYIQPAGEIELDVPYFVDLFGEYLVTERRTFVEWGINQATTVTSDSSNVDVSRLKITFQQIGLGFLKSGAIAELSDADLEDLSHQIRQLSPDSHHQENALRLFRKILFRPRYYNVPGIKQVIILLKGLEQVCSVDLKDITDLTVSDMKILLRRAPLVIFHNIQVWKNFRLPPFFDGYKPERLAKHAGKGIPWLELGREHLQREPKDLAAAHAAFKRAVEFSPKQLEGWQELGRVSYQLGDFSGAFRALQIAVRLKPRESVSWAMLATTHAHMGNMNGAIAALTKARILAPSSEIVQWAVTEIDRIQSDLERYSNLQASM